MMSIERNGPAVGSKVVASTDTTVSKGKAKANDGAQDASGGFLALLAALAPAPVAEDSQLLLPPTQGQQLPAQPVGIGDATDADPTGGLALLLAQAGEMAGDLATPAPAPTPTSLAVSRQWPAPGQLPTPAPISAPAPISPAPISPAPISAAALPLETLDVTANASPQVGDALVEALNAPAKRQPSGLQAVQSSAVSTDLADGADATLKVAADATQNEMLAKAAVDSNMGLDRAKQALLAKALPSSGTHQLQLVAATAAAEARAANPTSVLHDVAQPTANAATLATSGWSEGLIRPADRPVPKWAKATSGFAVEGAVGAQSFMNGARADMPTAIVNPSAATFQTAVAEKLSYWISQGVQNAEMELEGFGDEPVAVRISLKGDEAHIGFRTDQAEVRRLLEGASVQLKELLANEGLQLAQVSVGGSSQERSGQKDGRPPADAHIGAVKAPEQESVPLARRPGVSVGTAVDLFV